MSAHRARTVPERARPGRRPRSERSAARDFDNIEAASVWSQYRVRAGGIAEAEVSPSSPPRARGRETAGSLNWGRSRERSMKPAKPKSRPPMKRYRPNKASCPGLRRACAVRHRPESTRPISGSHNAPIPGVVIAVAASPGEVIESEKELFTVADLSTVWVQAEVYEKDLGRIRIGQTALSQVDTYPGGRFTGRVTYISDSSIPRPERPACAAKSRTRPALSSWTCSQRQSANHLRSQRIAVPEGAIQQVNGKPIVFIRAIRRVSSRFGQVTTGKTAYGPDRDHNGPDGGEMVATQGAFHLKSISARDTDREGRIMESSSTPHFGTAISFSSSRLLIAGGRCLFACCDCPSTPCRTSRRTRCSS